MERSYVILLDSSNDCSWNEYRTYSYLLRLGYKLVRHSPDITVTRYEKDIKLDQVLLNQKRSSGQSSDGEVNKNCVVVVSEVLDISSEKPEEITLSGDVSKSNNKKNDSTEVSKYPCANMDIELNSSDDVCLIEESQEIICIEDNTSSEELTKGNVNNLVKPTKKENDQEVILIDDDEDSVKEEVESILNSTDSLSSEDVVFVSSNKSDNPEALHHTFCTIDSFLKSSSLSSAEVIDLCGDNISAMKRFLEISDLTRKSKSEILNRIPSAKNGISYLQRPDPRLIPENIVPQYSEYKVNLNIKPLEPRPPNYRFPRSLYRNVSGFGRGAPRFQIPPLDQNLMRQAQEIQAMAMGMMHFATTLINMQNGQSRVSLLYRFYFKFISFFTTKV